MTAASAMHSWVAAHRNRTSFALQVDTRSDDPASGRSVLAAGRLAEELGFDVTYGDAGMQYFIAQVLDARDEETFRLLAQKVMPRIGTANGRHKRSVGRRGRAASR
jgi:hypothetical protein